MKLVDLKSFLKSTKGQAIKEVLFHIALSIVFVATFCAYWLNTLAIQMGAILILIFLTSTIFILLLMDIASERCSIKMEMYVHHYERRCT